MAVVRSFFHRFHGRADFAAVKTDHGTLVLKSDFSNGEFVAFEVLEEPLRDLEGGTRLFG